MPDDTIKNISLSMPSTSVQEHPQKVSVVPRGKKRRGREREGQEPGHEDENFQSSTELRDKVTITALEKAPEPRDEPGKDRGGHLKESKVGEIKHIDIKI